MDGRRILLAGLMLSGLVGCSRFTKGGPEPFVPQQPPAPPKSVKAPPQQPVNMARREKGEKDSTTLDAKPQNCVHIGDFHAELASDTTKAPGEREQFAKQAKLSYQRALQIDPKFLPAHMAMARINEVMGQRDEALSSYMTVLKLDANHIPAHVGVARVYEAAGQRSDALQAYQAALQSMPKEPALWYEQGMCLGRAKQFDEALACLRRAAELRPSFDDYNKAVGFMLARLGRAEEALPWLTKTMPEAEARYNLARMMQHIGQEEASRQQVNAVLKLDPNHLAANKMIEEMPKTGADPTIRTTSFRPDDAPAPAPVPSITTATTLPVTTGSAPAPGSPVTTVLPPSADLPTRPAQPRPMPLMPVVSDIYESKPAHPPQLRAPAPPMKSDAKRPAVRVDFEPTPE